MGSRGREGLARKESCVHELFEAQAARNPSAVALAWGAEEITYAELNHQANVLAARLKNAGACTGTVVGLCLDPNSMDLDCGTPQPF